MAIEAGKPVVAVYIRDYLSFSGTFVYRQLLGVADVFRPIVLTSNLLNPGGFPFDPVYHQGKKLPGKVYARLLRAIKRRPSVLTPRQRRFFERVLKDEGVGLIHAHFGNFALDLLPLAKSLGIPMVVTFHGADASNMLRNATYVRNLPELVDYADVITVSHEMAGRLAAIDVKPRRAHVHYIGVPLEDFEFVARKPLAEKIAAGEGVRFCQVAGFAEKKGHRYTLQAFARYAAAHPNAELILGGDGPLLPDIRAHCAELGLNDRVRFPGQVDKAEVIRLMAQSDVFLQHSVTASDGNMEGLPTALMEAMATGLIVVSTRHSGIPELIADGDNGYLVEERDLDGYVAKLESLSGVDPGMPRRARETVERSFDMKVQNHKLTEIYREAMAAGA
jgi:colanic acid/amylovoran biosynthesis glycosyltransferase